MDAALKNGAEGVGLFRTEFFSRRRMNCQQSTSSTLFIDRLPPRLMINR
ncbi:hypothetical protein P4S72_26590 [Vibrio sp. PP-XX7]